MLPLPPPGRAVAALGCAALAGVAACGGTLRRDPSPGASRPASTDSLGRPSAEALLDEGRSTTGERLRYPSGAPAQVVAQRVTIEAGQSTGWHVHGVPAFGYILSGRLEVEYAGIGRRQLGPGDRLMEAVDVPHNATNLGAEPVRILAVFMGAQGRPVVTRVPHPSMPEALAAGRAADLVDLAAADPTLRIDLRYATADNFTGEVIYSAPRALLQKPAAAALARANARAHREGYAIAVLDAYRPWSVTRMFWDRFPMHRGYLADPLAGSRHNRGCAVDVTLVELATGREVRMPSDYDDFSERAHPAWTGGTDSERAARDLLRRTMEAEGFTVYENEWWHFDFAGWAEWAAMDLPLSTIR